MNEQGQFEKIGYLIGVIIVGIVISIIFRELGDPYNLAPIVGAVVILLLIYIGIKS